MKRRIQGLNGEWIAQMRYYDPKHESFLDANSANEPFFWVWVPYSDFEEQ